MSSPPLSPVYSQRNFSLSRESQSSERLINSQGPGASRGIDCSEDPRPYGNAHRLRNSPVEDSQGLGAAPSDLLPPPYDSHSYDREDSRDFGDHVKYILDKAREFKAENPTLANVIAVSAATLLFGGLTAGIATVVSAAVSSGCEHLVFPEIDDIMAFDSEGLKNTAYATAVVASAILIGSIVGLVGRILNPVSMIPSIAAGVSGVLISVIQRQEEESVILMGGLGTYGALKALAWTAGIRV